MTLPEPTSLPPAPGYGVKGALAATPRAADATAPVLVLHVEQKINIGARVYRVFDDAGGVKGAQIGFARQKLRALREHFTLYADEARTVVVAEARTQKVFEVAATYVVTDAAGATLGSLRKKGRVSLLRSTFVLTVPGLAEITITERNAGIAVLRRIWDLIPYASYLPVPWQFHFDGRTTDGALVLSINRKRQFLDRYELQSFSPHLDGRLLAVAGVLTDALQGR